MKHFILLILGLLLGFNLFSQCNTNISICQPGVAGPFSFDTLPVPSTNPSSCLNFQISPPPPPNPPQISSFAYIILYITTSGPLNMLIEGSSAPGGGWLDVAIFDITGQANPCASLSPATEIGCNYAGSTGSCNQFGNTFPCASSVPAPMVNAGDVIMILVENFIQSGGSTFTLELSSTPGSAQTGAPNATISPVTPLTTTSPSVTMTAVNGGGTWSASCGSCIDPNTGLFDPTASGAGTFQVCYDIGVNPCDANDCINVTVTGTSSCDATITQAGPFCNSASPTTLTAAQTGGVWSGTGITNPTTGLFDPSLVPGNNLITYTLPCGDVDTMTIQVDTIPNPGGGPNNIGSVLWACQTYAPLDVIAFFNATGTPADYGGTWNPQFVSGTSVYDPAVDTSGIYYYTIINACGIDSVRYNIINYPVNANPGTNTVINICPGTAPFNLFDSLGGNPDTMGGHWGIPNPVLTPSTTLYVNMFDPATDTAGVYSYNIQDCTGGFVTATVTVNFVSGANPGSNGTVTMCSNDPASDLFTQLGGTPDAGGTWSPAMASGTGMFNPAVDPTGTYTYSINSSCGTVSSTVTVTVNSCAVPTASFTVSDTLLCSTTCIDYTETSNGGTSWNWSFPGGNPSSSTSQNPTICYPIAGTYQTQLIVSNTTGSDTTTQTIVVTETPTLTVSANEVIKQGEEVILSATGSVGSYLWTPSTWLSCATCPITIASPEETTLYTVTLSNNGCEVSNSILVTVDFDNTVYIPNVFSPNGDGINDIFFIQGSNIESVNFLIFDRWGEKVFESNSITEGWNGTYRGKEMNTAVFVYTAKIFFKGGERTTKTGDITILK